MEPLARPTSMERHVMELVEHLRNGIDNRAGFSQKCDAAVDHAFWLEKRCRELYDEVIRLEKAMIPGMPPLTMKNEKIDTRDPCEVYPRRGGAIVFDWEMERLAYRVMWRDWDGGDEKTARRIKRRAYSEILHRFRKEFEKTWTLNFQRRRQERS